MMIVLVRLLQKKMLDIVNLQLGSTILTAKLLP